MQLNEIWNIAIELGRVFNRIYGPSIEEIAKEAGLEGPEWFLLLPALTFEPEPVSTKRLRVRSPYTAPQLYDSRLESLQDQEYLSKVKDGFLLTDRGRDFLKKMIHTVYHQLEELSPIPQEEMQELAGLLHRLVEASLNAQEPPEKWSISHSRNIDSGEDAHAAIRIDQYLSDLAAYRDDAHLASWQMHDIPAHAWESFTFYWRGDASSIDELALQLERRGYNRNDYVDATQFLIDIGWVEEIDQKIIVTEIGNQIRQEAEELTDFYFFSPWICLSDKTQKRLFDLLDQFRSTLLEEIS
jgi:hypothetical protein